jgi:uncharacterized circularly permuted ATP-grasp superfamily protein
MLFYRQLEMKPILSMFIFSSYLGFKLVELSSDLLVREGYVWLKLLIN